MLLRKTPSWSSSLPRLAEQCLHPALFQQRLLDQPRCQVPQGNDTDLWQCRVQLGCRLEGVLPPPPPALPAG